VPDTLVAARPERMVAHPEDLVALVAGRAG